MPTHVYTVAEAAAASGISPTQVRNWVSQFADHLSPSANPPAGQARQLSPTDVATLQRVAELRAAGVAYADIPAQLPDQAADLMPSIEIQPAPTAQNALESTIAPVELISAIEGRFQSIQGELQRLQQAQAASEQKQVGQITTFAAGLIVGMVAILVIVGLFALVRYVGG